MPWSEDEEKEEKQEPGSGKDSDAVSDEILVHAHLEFSIC